MERRKPHAKPPRNVELSNPKVASLSTSLMLPLPAMPPAKLHDGAGLAPVARVTAVHCDGVANVMALGRWRTGSACALPGTFTTLRSEIKAEFLAADGCAARSISSRSTAAEADHSDGKQASRPPHDASARSLVSEDTRASWASMTRVPADVIVCAAA